MGFQGFLGVLVGMGVEGGILYENRPKTAPGLPRRQLAQRIGKAAPSLTRARYVYKGAGFACLPHRPQPEPDRKHTAIHGTIHWRMTIYVAIHSTMTIHGTMHPGLTMYGTIRAPMSH